MCEQFVVGQTHSFSIGLRDSTNQWIAKANPTLDTANDFLISINDGAWETLDNAPTVSPAGSEFVDVTFSIAETTAAGVGGYIKLRVADADEASGWIGGALRFEGVAAVTSTLTAAQVNAEVDTALADVGLTTTITGRIDAAVTTRATPAQVAAELATYDAPTKAELDSAVAPLATATALATVDTVVDGIAVQTTAIVADTGELQTDWANGGRLDTILDARASQASVDLLATAASLTATQTAITNAIAALNNLSTSDIDARLTAYDAATGTEAAAISAAIAALNNLTAAQVWAYATRSLTGTAAAQTAPVVGSTLNITRAATYSATLTGLTVPSGWTSARWTVKRSSQKASADGSTALIQILVSATPNAATDGLVVLNGSTSGLTLTDASLALSGTSATITIADHVTAQLAKDNYEYDIKFYHGSSDSTVVTEATCNVVVTPTQTV